MEKSWNFRKKEESQGKVMEWLSKLKSFTFPLVKSDDLSFYQNAISRSQGKVREDESRRKWPPGGGGGGGLCTHLETPGFL